jgi:hypothetical protein
LWLQLQLTLLALLFFRQMMPHGTTGDRADHAMMTCQVTCYGTHRGTLEAAARLDAV